MSLDLLARWEAYAAPFIILCYALSYLLESLWMGNSNARDYAFANFYADIGRNFYIREQETAVPHLVASAYGVVLDLGPGSGNQLPRFTPSSITKIYGLEPNAYFNNILQARVAEYSELAEKYNIVNAGLEDTDVLANSGVAEGTVDTVVCMQVLCSLSDPAAAARQIYRLLKPGGQLVFWEHQRST